MLSRALEHRSPRNIFRLGVIRTGFQKFSRCCFMVDSDFLMMMMRDLGSGTEDQGFSRSSTRVNSGAPPEGGAPSFL